MNLSALDLNLLVAFRALFEERHVTRAASRIGRSQPALSSALARLRTVFRDELFIRRPDGMEPTARAVALYEPVRTALDQIETALEGESAEGTPQRPRSFSLSMTDNVSFLLMPALSQRLIENSRFHLNIRNVGPSRGLELLGRGEVDLVVGPMMRRPPSHLAVETLYEEDIVSIARRDHPAFKKKMSMDALLSLPHVKLMPQERESYIDLALSQMGLSRIVVATTQHIIVAPFMVADSDLVALECSRTAETFAKFLDLRVDPLPRDLPGFTISMAWDRRHSSDANHMKLRESIREAAANYEPAIMEKYLASRRLDPEALGADIW